MDNGRRDWKRAALLVSSALCCSIYYNLPKSVYDVVASYFFRSWTPQDPEFSMPSLRDKAAKVYQEFEGERSQFSECLHD